MNKNVPPSEHLSAKSCGMVKTLMYICSIMTGIMSFLTRLHCPKKRQNPKVRYVRIANEIRMQFRRERKSSGTVSLQESLEADGDPSLTLADVLQDSFCMEERCEQKDDSRRARLLLELLPARERQIILLRYGLGGQPPLTQLEVAGLLGISRSYVSRLETHALEQMRQNWDAKNVQTF